MSESQSGPFVENLINNSSEAKTVSTKARISGNSKNSPRQQHQKNKGANEISRNFRKTDASNIWAKTLRHSTNDYQPGKKGMENQKKEANRGGQIKNNLNSNNQQQNKNMEDQKKILRIYRNKWRVKPLVKTPASNDGTSEQNTESITEINSNTLQKNSPVLSSSTSIKTVKSEVVKSLTLVPVDKRASITVEQGFAYENSTFILAFRQKKSVSQMDFKQLCRNKNCPMENFIKSPRRYKDSDMTLLYPQSSDTMLSDKQSVLDLDNIYSNANFYYAVHKGDSRLSGMRMFACIMLNAWRKRREEVKRLQQELDEMKKMSVRTKNQVHVFNTLFRVEQKRNDELNIQLKRSLEDINATKNSCEDLTTSLISVNADKALLQQQLHIKEQEYNDLNRTYSKTKADLFNVMEQQKQLQNNLTMEKAKVQELKNQKNDLINEVYDLSNEFTEKENDLLEIIKGQDEELTNLKKILEDSEKKVAALKESKVTTFKNHAIVEEKLKRDIEILHAEIQQLEERLQITLMQKTKDFLMSTAPSPQTVLQIFHFFMYCLIPATPPPSFPIVPISFNFCLKKALGVIKR